MDTNIDVTNVVLETEHLILNGHENIFDITTREDTVRIGTVELIPPWNYDDSQFGDKALKGISYTILLEHKGKGLVAEAVVKIIGYCFKAYNLYGITFEHVCDDAEASPVITACGFRYAEAYDGKLCYLLKNPCLLNTTPKRAHKSVREFTIAFVALALGMLVVGLVIIPAIVNRKSANSAVQETTTQTALEYSDDYTDIAFGKVCKYVDGEVPMDNLACAKGEIQPDWKAPVDGWDMTTVGDFTYLHQVYRDGALLLPLDYGANIYKIIGLDADESDIDCSLCDEKNDGGSDIVN